MTVTEFIRLGPVIQWLSASELNAIPKDVFFKGAARIMKGFAKKAKKMAKRALNGLKYITSNQAERNNFNMAMINAFVEKRNAKVKGRRRRTSTGSCMFFQF